MSTTTGLDLQRGRPLPAIGTTEAKLQQRKLDALKRGVHRIADSSGLPYGIHLIGIGGAGVKVVERFLSEAPTDLLGVPGSRLTALAVDIGDDDLQGVLRAAEHFDKENTHIEAISLEIGAEDELRSTVSNYSKYLKLEYPLYHPNPDSDMWLPEGLGGRDTSGSVPRALAKAVYGRAFYEGDRPMLKALKRFSQSVEATRADSLVCIVFGLAGGTGSAIAMDLSRHLSSGQFGRRVLVTGIGIHPHEEEVEKRAPVLHTVLSELDVLCDETKNLGVTVSCGEQYRNPFTAGFIVVPQSPNLSIEDSREEVEQQIASLFTQRRGANLWEGLRLLNWVAAPSTQHSAARTPWGARWIHMLGFGKENETPEAGDIHKLLGLLRGYEPEFIELRTHGDGGSESVAAAWTAALNDSLSPELPTQSVVGAPLGGVQFLLPRMARSNLAITKIAHDGYEALPRKERQALHSLLLDQGLLLCEPSTRLEGMAGACIGQGNQWVAVPLEALNNQAGLEE